MKITYSLAILTLVGLLAGCRGWPAAHDDVVKLQSVFRTYRQYTVPKNPTDTATVQAIGDNVDATLSDMEALTK